MSWRLARIVRGKAAEKILDCYTRGLLVGLYHYIKTFWSATNQLADFSEEHKALEALAQQEQNHLLLQLAKQVLVERMAWAGDVPGADRAEAEFRFSVQRLGGKSRQREWMVDLAMGHLDVACGRLDRAAGRVKRLMRAGKGYYTDGFGRLLSARLHAAWRNFDLALQEANAALAVARDPEVSAPVFEFRALATLADVHLALMEPAKADLAIVQMEAFPGRRDIPDGYFKSELLRRRALAMSFGNPHGALAVTREALAVAVRCDSPG